MTSGDIIICIVLLAAVLLALRAIRKQKKQGGCPCGGDCSHCCGHCHKHH